MRDAVELAGPLGTLLGSAQWKRASSRGEAGTSGFLSNSDSDCTVPAVLGQESHASSCLRNGILVASRVVLEVTGHLSSCVCNLPVFPVDAQVCLCPFGETSKSAAHQSGAEASQAPGTSPTLPQPAPSRARRLESGERWAWLAQARAASRPGLCAIAPGQNWALAGA